MKLFLLSFMLFASAFTARAQGVPQFRDYPAEVYAGPHAPLVLTRSARAYRTRIREAAQEKVNFAGHYILTIWGCGTSCVMGALIDAKTGRADLLPFTICCWPIDVDANFEPVVTRPDGKLVVFSGMLNEDEKTLGTHFYKYEGGKLILVRNVLKPAQ